MIKNNELKLLKNKLKKRIENKKKLNDNLKKDGTICKMESLLKEQSYYLDKKLENELQPDFLTKIKQKTVRDKMNVDYLFKVHNYEKKYSDHKKCKINYPLKNEVLRNNELFNNLLLIIKKMDKRILYLENYIETLDSKKIIDDGYEYIDSNNLENKNI